MTDLERGTDRLGRRAKRFLTPLQKYEVWLQLVRGETTISEAADRLGVDRSTIMRLRTVAKDGALAGLSESRPGVQAAKRDLALEAARAEAARLGEALKELAVQAPGARPMQGLLEGKVAAIVRLFEEWGETDRSRRKLAHRGSYLERVWVSPASVRRVLAREGLRLRPLPRPGRSVRKPFPD